MSKKHERLTNVDEAKLVEVIEIKSLAGDEDGLPFRQITEYYSKEGELLARNDPIMKDSLRTHIWKSESVNQDRGE